MSTKNCVSDTNFAPFPHFENGYFSAFWKGRFGEGKVAVIDGEIRTYFYVLIYQEISEKDLTNICVMLYNYCCLSARRVFCASCPAEKVNFVF